MVPGCQQAARAAYPGPVPEPDLAPAHGVPHGGASPRAGGAAAGEWTREPSWGMGEAALGWLAAQVGGMIMAQVVMEASGKDFDDMSLGLIALAQVGLWAGFLGAPWLAGRFKGNGMVRDFGVRIRGVDIPYGAFWGLLTQLVLIPLVYLPILQLTDIDNDDLSEPARNLTDRASDSFGVVMLVLIVGIGAPILEEIFYRGLVLRAIERRFGTWPAVLGSGIFFGVSHFEPLQMLALSLFGVVLGVLTVRNGRLGPAIAAHMAFNLVTVVALLN
jgi:hypothetical protein